jgi:hypothetical protein
VAATEEQQQGNDEQQGDGCATSTVSDKQCERGGDDRGQEVGRARPEPTEATELGWRVTKKDDIRRRERKMKVSIHPIAESPHRTAHIKPVRACDPGWDRTPSTHPHAAARS